jgi:hypothetical protein
LRGRRTAAPNRVNGRRLIRDIRPALARQLAKFREPIGKSLVLPPRNVSRNERVFTRDRGGGGFNRMTSAAVNVLTDHNHEEMDHA